MELEHFSIEEGHNKKSILKSNTLRKLSKLSESSSEELVESKQNLPIQPNNSFVETPHIEDIIPQKNNTLEWDTLTNNNNVFVNNSDTPKTKLDLMEALSKKSHYFYTQTTG